jgi:hypothetical protein
MNGAPMNGAPMNGIELVSKDRYGSTTPKQVDVCGGLDRSATELTRGFPTDDEAVAPDASAPCAFASALSDRPRFRLDRLPGCAWLAP